ncbi:MAG: ABC transporter permease, partial [Acidobacteriota bacterium]
YALSRSQFGFDGRPQVFDGWAYPAFVRMRAAVKNQAELIAVSYGERLDLTWGTGEAIEKAHVQYVSGWMFGAFGLRPALGRLFTERDDLHPGAHPVAVLSHDYWTRRFGQDRHAVGRTFQLGERLCEVIGVAEEKFTGTEPGTMTDIFLPAMMNGEVTRSDSTWHRTLVQLHPGVGAGAVNPIRERLNATSLAFESERAQHFTGMPKIRRDNFLKQRVLLDPAPSGVSDLQNDYRRGLLALGALVALVLLIACANVANLMTAQAAARAREMALRVSIGAGRSRLVQLVLVESAWLSSLAAALGGLFAWWSAPVVVGMINPPDNPARLVLPMDWRVWGFGLALIVLVTVLFGLLPALRASAVKPASTLKGGEDPHSRRRVMHALIALQAAFCFLVLFVGTLFVTTFERLTNQPAGFSAEGLLALDTVAQPARPAVFWSQMEERLRAVPGVERVGLASWPLLTGTASNGFISVTGDAPNDVLAFFLQVSSAWRDTMKIPLLAGRDFRADETGVAIVNETFARQYFGGGNPVGKFFGRTGGQARFQIVGLARDARYRNIREITLPVAYVPFPATGPNGLPRTMARATFLIRMTGSDPLALAPVL